MKLTMELDKNLVIWTDSLKKRLIQANRNTALQVWSDIVEIAPIKTGEYISSIQISDTEVNEDTISTSIYTDEMVEAKDGTQYNLGFLLENGTSEHAIPNAFGWGDIYGYDSPQYERTCKSDWHPGFAPMPHFQPSLDKNVSTYKDEVRKAIIG